LFGSRFAYAQTAIFFAEPCSKNAGETSIDLWVADCIHHSAIQTKRGAIWLIFSSKESAPANSKTGFYADRDPIKQEVEVIFA
jgi:hypothetical protein